MAKPVPLYLFRGSSRLSQRLPAVCWHPGSDPSLFHCRWLPKVKSLGRQQPGFREEKEASTWDEPLARAPPQVAPPGPRNNCTCSQPRACTHVTTRGPTVSVASPGFPFPIPPSMSHVALSQVSSSSSSSSIVNQPRRLVRGSPERLYMRVRYINLPLAAFVLPNSPDISPSLVPPCPVLFCLPRLSLPPGPPLPPQSTPQNGRLLPNWPPCPLPVSKCSLGRTPTMAPG